VTCIGRQELNEARIERGQHELDGLLLSHLDGRSARKKVEGSRPLNAVDYGAGVYPGPDYSWIQFYSEQMVV
jgi:hypothetical protein